MGKRLCIFSFYDKDGYADRYIFRLLEELKKVTSRLIIVANGILQDESRQMFKQYTEEILVRENIGYDAGAYKDVLMWMGRDEIKKYDELIFCNDTFFGPFCSFETIFNQMEEVECDFWGLNGFFNLVFSHMQSFFLVFRKEILQEDLVFEYFQKFIDENTTSLDDVYGQFERGLFDELARVYGKKYAKYAVDCSYNVYRCSYIYLKDYGLPIVKKRAFSNYEEDKENIWRTLSLIKYKTSYDICMVLECIRRIYGLEIKEDEIREENFYVMPEKVEMLKGMISEAEIEKFIGTDEFYIFGAGRYARQTYWRFARNSRKFRGFIVSDGKKDNPDHLYGFPVYLFSKVSDIQKTKVLLGVDGEFSREVYPMFPDKECVLWIFD